MSVCPRSADISRGVCTHVDIFPTVHQSSYNPIQVLPHSREQSRNQGVHTQSTLSMPCCL